MMGERSKKNATDASGARKRRPVLYARLIPDTAEERSGYWEISYIYDAGRIVTVRCKYADKKTIDIKLSQRVNRCDYKIDAQKTLILRCK
jgi:hypothetical protein